MENTDKFRGIFDSTFTFIGFLSPDGVLLEANNTAIEVAGIKHEDVIGKYFWDCYWWQSSEAERERLRTNIALAAQGQETTYEAEVLIKDRAKTTILFSLRPLKNSRGEVISIIPEGCPIQDLVDARIRLEAVIEGANAGIWEWTLQDNEIVINDRWARMLGYTPEELHPLHLDDWFNLIHPEDREQAKTKMEASLRQSSQAYEMEYRAQHKLGNWVWVVDRAKLFDLNKDGVFEVMIGTRQDITHVVTSEEKLRVSEQTFSNSFYYSGIGMALVASSGRWLKVNPRLCAIVGYSETELLSLTFQDITHPDDLSADEALLQDTIDGNRDSYQMEKRYRHKQGHFVDAILSVSAIRESDGHILYFVSQIVDITERKQVERLKSEFISTVSHELRSPLTSIYGSIKLILGGALGALDAVSPKAVKLLNSSLNNAQRLIHLINDLLDIEKISAGKMEFNLETHRLAELVNQAVDSVFQYGESKITLNYAPEAADVIVLVDDKRLVQVLTNLLSNAIKFSSPDDMITVSVTIDRDHAEVAVQDRGIGIPDAFMPRVFEKFSQVDATNTRQVKGTGLGLAISRELVESMNGSIGFESEEGQGSTFWVRLPIFISTLRKM